MSTGTRTFQYAEELRQSFDSSFTKPHTPPAAGSEEFLGIQVAGDSFLLRLREVAGIHADKVVTPLPGSAAGLLGVAGFRGKILPVYDLASFLGYPGGRRAPRWLAVSAESSFAAAFDRFEGRCRAVGSGVDTIETAPARQHVREIVRTETSLRGVVHLLSVLEAIARLSGRRPSEE